MADTVENLNVLAKEVFGSDGVPDLVPNQTKVQKIIPFSKSELLGLKYVQTVRLALPGGFTHAAGDGTAGAFSFQNATAGTSKRAELTGSQILLRDQMSYEDAHKLARSKAAFKEGAPFFFEGMQKAMRKRIEVELLYGGQGIGKISGTPATSGSNKVITILTSSFAPLIWSGMEGMELDCYNSSSQINTNAPLVIVSVDIDARTVTVSGNATDLGNLADTYDLYFRGAYGKEMTGVHGILSNVGSLFGISASTYNLWKASSYSPTSGPSTFEKVKKAVSKAVNRGLDEDMEMLMHPSAWEDINSDISALRKTDKTEVKKVEVGAEEIVFHSQCGEIRLVPSGYIKEGYHFGLCKDYWKRVGAADATFSTPGFEGEMFLHLPSNAGVESRIYTHQAVICLQPAKQLLIDSIVNSTP